MSASSRPAPGHHSRTAASRRVPGRVVSPFRTDTFERLEATLGSVFGSRTAKALSAVGLHTVDDLMHYTPRDYLSGTQRTDLRTLVPDERAAVVAEVASLSSAPFRGDPRRYRLEARLTDGRGFLNLIFFGKKYLVDYWQRQLSMGERGIFVGKIGEFNDQLQMTHPDFVMLDAAGRIVGAADEKRALMAQVVTKSDIIGIYPARATLPTWQIAECMAMGLDMLAGIVDFLPPSLVREEGLVGLWEAFDLVHRPKVPDDVARGLKRLKFDEALGLQLLMAYRRKESSRRRAPVITHRSGGLLDAFDAALPFTLTRGQRAVGDEIAADMSGSVPMARLVQGEVGSGKTVVALRAMLAAVDAGHQAVLLAPTEVLAGQHEGSIRKLLGPLAAAGTLDAPEHATHLVLLTGAVTGAARKQALAAISSGQAGLVVGTHALLSEAVHFSDIGLIVVDEQHRFGVEQRAVLADQGDHRPHQLVLTATPIPRSVAMTVFGDLELSTLSELPQGRAGVQTTAVLTAQHPTWLARVWQRVLEEVHSGRQAFVVCPRVSQTDGGKSAEPVAAAQEVFERLGSHELKGLRLGLLHGRMSGADKESAMAAFAAGQTDVLVTTTVIEVGVDVPNASAMVVLDADRYGVSQLHQLRGRIGRGSFPGICLFVSGVDPRTPAAQRLQQVAQTNDGFAVAELDLEQRREGDVLGAEQAGGRSTLRLLRVLDDADLIGRARDVAAALSTTALEALDPGLQDMVKAAQLNTDAAWMERD
ncbi:ATP-dependent DNA helicase RecG [Propionibacterium sp.]|uniref:ATP-dependent DNA helicase RecG n=1 Tax=Propionibacterium sp. TaxID=1977903 RepID=UPI00345EDE36